MQIWTSNDGVAGVVTELGRSWSGDEGEFVDDVGTSLASEFNITGVDY